MAILVALVLPIVILASWAPALALTWHVPSQCPTIQAGIDSASAGDTVLVACGTYFEHDIVLKSGISVRSETGQLDCVTIDAEYAGRVLYCDNAESTATVEGCTITHGVGDPGGAVYCTNSSLAMINCDLAGNATSHEGGGVCASSSELTLTNCIVRDNWSNAPGGGVYGRESNVDAVSCTFSGNSGGLIGGGLACRSATLSNCTFSDNSARLVDWSGGSGGGVLCGSITATNCAFRGNTACEMGGAVYCSSALVSDCIFFDNSAATGGAMCCADSGAICRNSTFSGNSAGWGGSVFAGNSTVTLESSIIAFTTGAEAVGCDSAGSATLTYCDLYGNAGGDWVGCIADQFGENGNFSGDPLFCDQNVGDLRPCPASPCLPEGNDWGVLIGALDSGECDCPKCETLAVPGEYATIGEALAAASYCDTVLVYPGTYQETISIPWGVLVRSAAGPESTVIDGAGDGTVVRISYSSSKADQAKSYPAALDGFTVTGGTLAGLVIVLCDPVITHCVVTGNSSPEGGGMACLSASPTISHCVFSNNRGDNWGGGLYAEGSSPTVTSCTFRGNSAPKGGGIYGWSSRLVVQESIVAFCHAGGSILCEGNGEAVLWCCDLYGNAGGDWIGCVADQYGVDGNFSEDPLFCDQDAGDVRLCESSPCLAANNSCGILIGASDVGECTCPVCEVLTVPYDYATIGEALNAASYCDTVLVYPGTYQETVVIPGGVTVCSTAGPDSTVISGVGNGVVIRMGYVSEKNAISRPVPRVLDGFTVTGGTDSGIRILGCNPVIRHCVVIGNSSYQGAGICIELSSPSLSDCVLADNAAARLGGGVYCRRSSPILVDCVFSGNRSDFRGGGMASEYSDPRLVGCEFFENDAAEWGGGMYFPRPSISSTTLPRLEYCTFYANSASEGGGLACGSAQIASCTFFGNLAPQGSGLMCTYRSTVSLENTVIAFGLESESIYCHGPDENATLVCCNIYGNAGGDWVGCIADQIGTGGNISADPRFCDAQNRDLHLDATSPCADDSQATCGQIGAFGVRCGSMPPELTLGVLQNPYLTQCLDLFLVSSGVLDSSSVTLTVESDSVNMRLVDAEQHVWMGDYDLASSDDSILLEACASDLTGNTACTMAGFSAKFLRADQGGTIASPDGRLRCTIGPGSLSRDVYVLVLPVERESILREWTALKSQDGNDCQALVPSGESPMFQISPAGVSLDEPAYLQVRYDNREVDDHSLDRIYIDRLGSGPLESFVDPNAQIVSATTPEFGTFHLASGSHGHSRISDPVYLQVDQNFPNPFRASTTLRFEVRASQKAKVSIFDVSGREVMCLLDRLVYPGVHELIWPGRSRTGQLVPPGVYFCRVQNEHSTSTRKILIVR